MNQRKDYTELVIALQEGDHETADRLLKELIPRLAYYLRVRLGATPSDAEDAVQQAFANTYQKIISDEIRDKQYIYKYLLKACRHTYLRNMKKNRKYEGELNQQGNPLSSKEQQLEQLLDADRQRVLEECLEKLKPSSRELITYIIAHPEATTKALSKRFGLSEANVRVKKTRIMSDLSHCVQKNMEK